MINFSLFLAQRFNSKEIEVVAIGTNHNNGDSESQWVIKRLEQKLCDAKEGAEMRATFEKVLIVFRNQVHREYTFPDPRLVELERLGGVRAEAERKLRHREGQLQMAQAPFKALEEQESEVEKARIELQEAQALFDEMDSRPSGIVNKPSFTAESLLESVAAAPPPPSGADGLSIGTEAIPAPNAGATETAPPAE
jgi:hypothetical protein